MTFPYSQPLREVTLPKPIYSDINLQYGVVILKMKYVVAKRVRYEPSGLFKYV